MISPIAATRPKQTRLLLTSLACALIFTACSGQTYLRNYLKNNEAQLSQPHSVNTSIVEFVVDPGTPARVIGQNLLAANLIGDEQLFEAYVSINGLANTLDAGAFQLSPAMTMIEIVDALQNAQAASIRVTIPEGWRFEQIVDRFGELNVLGGTGAVGLEQYATQVRAGDLTGLDPTRYPFLQDRPAGTSLEGYLFPDTYDFPTGMVLDESGYATRVPAILGRQLDNFANRIAPLYAEAVGTNATTLDLYTVLIVASIVEREAVIDNERPDIAGVYLNRLRQGIKLEADPTVQYAMGYQPASGQWWKTPVFLSEYSSVDSPYNTYLYPGLPPGPIANPGLSSIRAVLYPTEHDFIYFVAVPEQDGRHVFAKTFEEHVVNVNKYLGR